MPASNSLTIWDPTIHSFGKMNLRGIVPDSPDVVDELAAKPIDNSDVVVRKERKVERLVAPRAFDSPAIREALARLERFEKLDYDWDGEGADTIDAHVINKATQIIREMRLQGMDVYFVAPGRSGNVQLEYKGTYGREVEIVVGHGDGETAEIEVVIFDGERVVYDGSFDSRTIRKVAMETSAAN